MRYDLKTEKRNIQFGFSCTKKEKDLLDNLSKDLAISRTELIIRAIREYKKN